MSVQSAATTMFPANETDWLRKMARTRLAKRSERDPGSSARASLEAVIAGCLVASVAAEEEDGGETRARS